MTATTLPANIDERHKFLAGLVEQVAAGKTFRQLQDELGIPRSTLNGWLLSNVPEQYLPAKDAGISARITDAVEDLETARNHSDISRARELIRAWCFIAERQLRRWAPKQEISGPNGGAIQVEDGELARRYAFIRGMAQRNTIDVEPIASSGENHNP